MPSSKKRPGAAAAIRLASSEDVDLWERVERQYDSVRSEALLEAQKNFTISLGSKPIYKDLTKDQLMDIVGWKFAVGKPRPQNLGLLRSNNESHVKTCSSNAFQLAREIQAEECLTKDTGELNAKGNQAVKEALGGLTQLKGVGPATATAVLCRSRPDIFCYMYDEVIDTFEAKRDYTMNIYLRINSKCLQLAKALGDGWTTHRVATVLWTAARVLAQGGEDLTASIEVPTEPTKSKKEAQGQTSRKRKRNKQ